MSAKDAVLKYCERQLGKTREAHQHNQRPEFEVKKAVLRWLKANGFSCHAVESKAVYSASAGRYVSGQTAPGVADIFGCAPNGVAVFIELKSAGRRSTLKNHQREFLVSKINVGAFAVCADSVDCLEKAWAEFDHLRMMEPMLAKNYLLRHLPKQKITDEWSLE